MWLYEADIDEQNRYAHSVMDTDSVLDGLNFSTLILELSANYPKEKINKNVVFKQFMQDLEIRIEDAKFLLNLCMDNIIKAARGDE
jgi:hypothetical protein